MRRISHFAVLKFTTLSGVLLVFSALGFMPLWLFLSLLGSIMFMFGWAAANMNSMSMEPLGAVAGTASSAFGFIQTVGGALCGSYIGQQFSGTWPTVPPKQTSSHGHLAASPAAALAPAPLTEAKSETRKRVVLHLIARLRIR
jgi:hypothetical protein